MKGTQILTALLTASSIATQAQLAESTFDTNADGWLVADRVIGSWQFIGTRSPNYLVSGGNPAGCIQNTDLVGPPGSDWYWRAPSKFLGDKSMAYGGRLEFDIQSDLHDVPITYGSVVLIGASITNYAYFPALPTTAWTHRSIEISAGTGWTNVTTGLPTTQEEMQATLAALEVLDIWGEFGIGLDTGRIDNVALYGGCPAAAIRVSEVEICWPSVSNAVYQVEFRSDLTTNMWTTLFANIVASNLATCVADKVTSGTPQRFYRVVCPNN